MDNMEKITNETETHDTPEIVNPFAALRPKHEPLMPDPLDVLKEEDYPSRAAWLEACADMRMKQDQPEYQAAYARMKYEAAKRDMEADKQQFEDVVNELKSHIKLTNAEYKRIRQDAAQEVLAKVANGTTDPSKAEDEIFDLTRRREKAAIAKKARHAATNALFRMTCNVPTEPAAQASKGKAPTPNEELRTALRRVLGVGTGE